MPTLTLTLLDLALKVALLALALAMALVCSVEAERSLDRVLCAHQAASQWPRPRRMAQGHLDSPLRLRLDPMVADLLLLLLVLVVVA